MRKYILPITAVACIAAVTCMICALAIKRPKENKFTPHAFDTSVQIGIPSVTEDVGYSEINAKAFKVSICGKLIVNDDKVDLYLTNPKENVVWLKVRVLDKNSNILGETGLVKPGEYVQSLILDTVPKQSEMVSLKIMAYEPNTYYSAGAAILNTTPIIR